MLIEKKIEKMKKRRSAKGRPIKAQPRRRNAELKDNLRRQTHLLKKTFDRTKDAIFLLTTENPSTIVECNRAASEIFRYDISEMVGRPMDFLHTSEDSLRKFQAQLLPGD